MRVKNVSKKIINVGGEILLPDGVTEVPKKFEGNPNLEALIEMDFIVTLKDKKPVEEGTEAPSVPENLDKMKRVELVEICEKNGIEIAEDDTKAILCEKIREAFE